MLLTKQPFAGSAHRMAVLLVRQRALRWINAALHPSPPPHCIGKRRLPLRSARQSTCRDETGQNRKFHNFTDHTILARVPKVLPISNLGLVPHRAFAQADTQKLSDLKRT
jgi:hypothetical protein